MIERLKRRKENHNHIERKRRDHINNTIYELAEVLPNAKPSDCKLNKGNILKATLQHIKVRLISPLFFLLPLCIVDDAKQPLFVSLVSLGSSSGKPDFSASIAKYPQSSFYA